MKKITCFAIAICALLHNYATASNWAYVTDGAKSYVAVDLDSLAPSGKYWKAWVKTEYEKDQLTDSYPKKTYKTAKYLQYFDCASKVSAITRWLAYDDEGNVAESSVAELNPKSFNERIPDTVGESVGIYVCKQTAKLTGKK